MKTEKKLKIYFDIEETHQQKRVNDNEKFNVKRIKQAKETFSININNCRKKKQFFCGSV